VPPLPSPPPNLQNLNLKSEVDRRKTFKYWRVPFMDVNQMAAAGFFFTNRGDVFRCTFCGVQVGQWEGDNAFKDHQHWSPSCAFFKGLFVGTISAPHKTSQQQPSGSLIWSLHQKPRVQSVASIYLLPMYNYSSRLIFILLQPLNSDSTLAICGMVLCTRISHHITPECTLLQVGLPVLNTNLKI